jgi:hypothetical protein
MSLRNAVTLPSTTHATSGGTDPTYGYDDNFATCHTGTDSHANAVASTITLVSEHTFATAKNITQIKYQFYSSLTYAGLGSGSGYFKVEVQQGGIYTTVYTKSFGTGVTNDGILTLSTGWTAVTAIKATAYGSVVGESGSTCVQRLYEVQAFYTIKKSYAGYV